MAEYWPSTSVLVPDSLVSMPSSCGTSERMVSGSVLTLRPDRIIIIRFQFVHATCSHDVKRCLRYTKQLKFNTFIRYYQFSKYTSIPSGITIWCGTIKWEIVDRPDSKDVESRNRETLVAMHDCKEYEMFK